MRPSSTFPLRSLTFPGVAYRFPASSPHARCFSSRALITARPFFARRGYELVAEQEVTRRGVRLKNFVMRKER